MSERNLRLGSKKKNFYKQKEKSEFVNIEEKIEEPAKETSNLIASASSSTTSLTSAIKKTMTDEEKRELRKKLQEKALRIQTELDAKLKETNMQSKNKVTIEKDSDDDDSDEDEDEDEENNLKIDESYVEETTSTSNFMHNLENDIKHLDLGEKFESLAPPITTPSAQTFEDMLKEYEKNIDRKNNEMMEQMFKTRRDSDLKSVKSVKWSDEHLDEDKGNESYDEDDEEENDLDLDEENKENQDEVNVPAESKTIKITHTTSEKIEEKLRNLKVSRVKPELNSPGDIYTVFYKPKSILKPSMTSQLDDNGNNLHSEVDRETQKETSKSEIKNAEFEKFEPQKVKAKA